MAEDREILKEIWDGKIPVSFNLASEEVFTVDKPEPLYLLVPRQSYFPLVTDHVQRHFMPHVDPEQDKEMWLETEEGQALKWNQPIGVLFDLYGSEGLLPWNVTVHFFKFPEDEVLHCHSKEVVEAHFMATIKEADTLKHRSQVINGMQKNEHRQLWTGLQNDKFDQFWAVNRKLMEHASGEELFRHIPFRIHRRGRPTMTQKLFRPVSDEGQLHALRDLLEQFASDALDNENNLATHKVLIQGITVPLDTTLQWLSEHFSHPDNFLYITVIPK